MSWLMLLSSFTVMYYQLGASNGIETRPLVLRNYKLYMIRGWLERYCSLGATVIDVFLLTLQVHTPQYIHPSWRPRSFKSPQ
jgi:hypothetical protein